MRVSYVLRVHISLNRLHLRQLNAIRVPLEQIAQVEMSSLPYLAIGSLQCQIRGEESILNRPRLRYSSVLLVFVITITPAVTTGQDR